MMQKQMKDWPPFDVQKVLAMPFSDPVEIPYSRKDVLLYNVGIGCTDLRFLYEKHPDFSVFPTFAIQWEAAGAWDRFPRTTPGLNISGQHVFEMRRPLPPNGGKVFAESRVVGFHDKGFTASGRHKGALVEFETFVTDEAGNDLCRIIYGMFYRGIHKLGDIGSFEGGGVTYSDTVVLPERPPDMVIDIPIPNNAHVIYRLSGDYMPHHIDPEAAKRVGYDKVILHGACTFGYVTKSLLASFCNNDVSRLQKVTMRASAPVYIGEFLLLEVWHDEQPGRIWFQVRARERNEVVMNNAYFEFAPAGQSSKL